MGKGNKKKKGDRVDSDKDDEEWVQKESITVAKRIPSRSTARKTKSSTETASKDRETPRSKPSEPSNAQRNRRVSPEVAHTGNRGSTSNSKASTTDTDTEAVDSEPEVEEGYNGEGLNFDQENDEDSSEDEDSNVNPADSVSEEANQQPSTTINNKKMAKSGTRGSKIKELQQENAKLQAQLQALQANGQASEANDDDPAVDPPSPPSGSAASAGASLPSLGGALTGAVRIVARALKKLDDPTRNKAFSSTIITHTKGLVWLNSKFIDDEAHQIQLTEKAIDKLKLVGDIEKMKTPEQKEEYINRRNLLVIDYACDLNKAINDQRNYAQVSSWFRLSILRRGLMILDSHLMILDSPDHFASNN